MKTFQTSIKIAANREAVWRVLTQEMPQDPTPFGIEKLEGTLRAGAKLRLWSADDPKRAFTLKVTSFDPPTRMVWSVGMPFGLFTGTRVFKIEPEGSGSVFEMREDFTGPMSGLISRSIPDLTPSFETFASALKERAEIHD